MFLKQFFHQQKIAELIKAYYTVQRLINDLLAVQPYQIHNDSCLALVFLLNKQLKITIDLIHHATLLQKKHLPTDISLFIMPNQ